MISACAEYAAASRQPWSEPPILEPPPATHVDPALDELRDAIAEAKIVGIDGKPVLCVFEPIEPKNDGGGKRARAMMSQGIVEAGHVYILDGASWADDFIGEVCSFPNGKRDDRVDALTQALNFYRGALSAMQRWEALSK
jgi:hypothetical protein